MNSMKAKTMFVMAMLLITTIPVSTFRSGSTEEDLLNANSVSSVGTGKDVLIVSDPLKYAYFGLYRPTAFSIEILNLLNRTVLWASSYSQPNETSIILFSEPGDSYAGFVRDWLVGGGYSSDNIANQTSANVEEFSPDYYEDTDLVIYWNTFGYDSSNVVDSGTPIITISAMQTDEMGIGTGIVTVSDSNDTFHVVDTGYYPTESYTLGPLILDDSYSFQATEALAAGDVLIVSEVESVTTEVEMSMVQNVTVQSDGSSDMSFGITIPDSPLADTLREAFFEDASNLDQDVEYGVPENRSILEESKIEDTISDVALKGDVSDGDGVVDSEDLELISASVGYAIGDEAWNPNLDLNLDGKIDIRDLAIAAHNYGKTVNNTGSLYVSGYYNGEPVNCTDVYYRGPEGSTQTNISGSGHVWYHLLPGNYSVFGTFNGTEELVEVTINPKEVTYAQLDFGGTPPPIAQQTVEPVRAALHEGISMEQLILLGFDVSITDSNTIPWSTNNNTIVSLAGQSLQLADLIVYPEWQIRVGPVDDDSISMAAEFIFTKIQYMMLMLQSLPGDQVYKFDWQIGFDLPAGSTLLNPAGLDGLNWTIDFGEGTIIQANVSVISGRVVVEESLVVSEGNITATESYLIDAFGQYRMFSINYTYTGGFYQAAGREIDVQSDWSKTWTRTIAPGSFQKRISMGPASLTLKAIPTLTVNFFLGWERKWSWSGYKLQWFQSWMKVTPSIRVEASADVTLQYTLRKSYTFWTWSTRFTFWAGSVLVWANLKLTVTGSVELTAYGRISVSTWAEAKAWYKAGVRWENGWSPIWESGRQATYGRPTVTGSVGVSITPAVSCRLAFLLYDVGGPFVEAVAYAPISIDYFTNQANTWSIQLKLKINVGVTLAGWIKKIIKVGEYSRTVADFLLMSWQGTW
ncbi:MAG: hypothetical protein JSW61_08025 [Candidatus Thorarchaeota archaeon]|nr:MAG: hypothetical protein JSW61_08025 [Candidatus Thorarchaeota archaeon]